ncbi:unnamed protein product [Tenebrio molitor]|nr:unnamed protein product [Tenebrio molitor]
MGKVETLDQTHERELSFVVDQQLGNTVKVLLRWTLDDFQSSVDCIKDQFQQIEIPPIPLPRHFVQLGRILAHGHLDHVPVDIFEFVEEQLRVPLPIQTPRLVAVKVISDDFQPVFDENHNEFQNFLGPHGRRDFGDNFQTVKRLANDYVDLALAVPHHDHVSDHFWVLQEHVVLCDHGVASVVD